MKTFYLINPFPKLHLFLVECIERELIRKGNNVINCYSLEMAYNEQTWMKQGDILILFIHPLYLLKNSEMMNFMENEKVLRCQRILYITEPLTLSLDRMGYQQILKKYKIYDLWTYTEANRVLFKPTKIHPFRTFHRISPLYNETFNWLSLEEDGGERDRDKLVFIGNMSVSRKKVIEDCFDEEIEKIEHKTEIWTKEEWKEMLRERRFYLNLHRIPGCPCLEYLRIIPILSNGGVVISERCNEVEMNELRNYNIFFCDREQIYEVWKRLKDNMELEEINNRWELFRNEMIMNISFNL